jgi:hypothetical protein
MRNEATNMPELTLASGMREYEKPIIESIAVDLDRNKPVRLAALIIGGVAAVAAGTWAIATFTSAVEPFDNLLPRDRSEPGPSLVILPGLTG